MRKIRYYLLIISLAFICLENIQALIMKSPSTVYVDSRLVVTINAKGLTGRFNITSSDGSVLSGGEDSIWIEDNIITVYFRANNAGKAIITLKPVDVSDTKGNAYTKSESITIKVIKKNTSTPIDINKTYSKNNYLKSLGIEGYELNPGFNKDTLEYSVTLSPGTEKIKVTGALEDSKASVKGLGEINVTEGVNTINVVVTAENGNERTYKLVVSVEEKDPINITINNKKYRVIKKREVLGSKNGYDSVDIKINDIGIPALYNEVTGVTLVGLKDENGTISLFSYDSSTGEYSEYKEFTFDLMNLYVHENKNSKYEKITIKLNGEDTIAYKIPSLDDYYLIYGTNTTTGYEGYYLYDKKENSIQRYDTKLLDKLTGEKNKYLNVVLVLSSVCFLTMLFLLIEVNRDNKREKEIEE